MTAIPMTIPDVKWRWLNRRPEAIRRWLLPSAIVIVVLAMTVIGIVGQSYATLPLDVEVISTEDPLEIGAATRATIEITNRGDAEMRPRFSVSWLPYPYYWRVVSGPKLLQPGETARYVIEAPESVAAPSDGERFRIKVNDATSITYAVSEPIQRGDTRMPIVNPGLRMWTQRDPATGLLSPAGWYIDIRRGKGDIATIEPGSVEDVEGAHFRLYREGRIDGDKWADAGLWQQIPFPIDPLQIQVWSDAPYQAITDGWLSTAFGLEVRRNERERIWFLFQHTGRGDLEYDLPNGHRIKVFDVPQRRWVVETIDIAGTYERLNWRKPKNISIRLLMAASESVETDIEGYVAGLSLPLNDEGSR